MLKEFLLGGIFQDFNDLNLRYGDITIHLHFRAQWLLFFVLIDHCFAFKKAVELTCCCNDVNYVNDWSYVNDCNSVIELMSSMMDNYSYVGFPYATKMWSNIPWIPQLGFIEKVYITKVQKLFSLCVNAHSNIYWHIYKIIGKSLASL